MYKFCLNNCLGVGYGYVLLNRTARKYEENNDFEKCLLALHFSVHKSHIKCAFNYCVYFWSFRPSKSHKSGHFCILILLNFFLLLRKSSQLL